MSKKWIEVVIKLSLNTLNASSSAETNTTVDIENIESLLLDLGAVSVTLTDADSLDKNPVLEPLPGTTPLWPSVFITGLFDLSCDIDKIRSDLSILQAGYSGYSVKKISFLEDKDWIRSWMDHYKPMKFGDNLWICPTHIIPPEPNIATVMLDPGLAFGTGTHPSTALCLTWLSNNKDKLLDKDIMDYGCGSGILGIAAKILGARKCFSVDIDEQAVTATKTNAARNNVDLVCSTCSNSPNSSIDKNLHELKVNITLANILSGPLIALAPILSSLTLSGGYLVLAGLLDHDAQLVKNSYSEWFDFLDDTSFSLNGWTLLCGIKR